jgi:hypothetical protein
MLSISSSFINPIRSNFNFSELQSTIVVGTFDCDFPPSIIKSIGVKNFFATSLPLIDAVSPE